MATITIYDINDGKINRVVGCPERAINYQLRAGEFYVRGRFDDRVYYISDGMPEPRPTMAPVVSGTTINNLPAECRVRVGQEAVVVGDGILELSFDFPGTYPVKLSCFPYLDATVEVTA